MNDYFDFKTTTFNRTRIESVDAYERNGRFMFTVVLCSSEKTYVYFDEAERDQDYKLFNELKSC